MGEGMIHESGPWKAQLLRDATLLERWAREPEPSETRSFRIERRVFLAAYAMRKLDEGLKLSTALLGKPIQVQRFDSTRPGYAAHTSYGFDRYFDLKHPRSAELPRRDLLNMLIHSLAYIEVVGDAGTYDGFMVTSDRERERALFEVDLAAYTKLMREAGRDYPSEIRRAFDANRGRWITWTGHGDPPPEVQRRLRER